jgi:hypothetical protein
VVRERLLSVMLCLVFVMTMFPFSAAAESDHFVTEGDEQVISVSEDVYGEEDSDIDSGNYEDEQDNSVSEDVYEEQGNEDNDMDNKIVDNSWIVVCGNVLLGSIKIAPCTAPKKLQFMPSIPESCNPAAPRKPLGVMPT